jgi:hypothetical protein
MSDTTSPENKESLEKKAKHRDLENIVTIYLNNLKLRIDCKLKCPELLQSIIDLETNKEVIDAENSLISDGKSDVKVYRSGDLIKHTIDRKTVIEMKAIDNRVEIIKVKYKSFGQNFKEALNFGMNNLKLLLQKKFFRPKYISQRVSKSHGNEKETKSDEKSEENKENISNNEN